MDQHSDGLASIERRPGRATQRSFGLALAVLCLSRCVWSWTNSAYTIATVAGCVSVALAGVALLRPSTFDRPYVLWSVLSFPLRWLLSFVVLAVLYFALITPVACGVRIARRLVAREQKPHSHWRASPPRGDKPSYFRQF